MIWGKWAKRYTFFLLLYVQRLTDMVLRQTSFLLIG